MKKGRREGTRPFYKFREGLQTSFSSSRSFAAVGGEGELPPKTLFLPRRRGISTAPESPPPPSLFIAFMTRVRNRRRRRPDGRDAFPPPSPSLCRHFFHWVGWEGGGHWRILGGGIPPLGTESAYHPFFFFFPAPPPFSSFSSCRPSFSLPFGSPSPLLLPLLVRTHLSSFRGWNWRGWSLAANQEVEGGRRGLGSQERSREGEKSGKGGWLFAHSALPTLPLPLFLPSDGRVGWGRERKEGGRGRKKTQVSLPPFFLRLSVAKVGKIEGRGGSGKKKRKGKRVSSISPFRPKRYKVAFGTVLTHASSSFPPSFPPSHCTADIGGAVELGEEEEGDGRRRKFIGP